MVCLFHSVFPPAIIVNNNKKSHLCAIDVAIKYRTHLSSFVRLSIIQNDYDMSTKTTRDKPQEAMAAEYKSKYPP